jgi:hypothetical protein
MGLSPLFFVSWEATGQSLGKWGVFGRFFFCFGRERERRNNCIFFPYLVRPGEEEEDS